MDNEETIELLNDLLHVSKDGERTFLRALAIAEDPELEAAIRSTLRSCVHAADQLAMKIEDLGGKPERHGTVPGAFHRAWIETRTSLSRPRDRALLDEIVRAERAAVRHFEEAVARPLPEAVRGMVTAHTEGAQENLRRFEALA